jgi:hypothetical protein
MKKTLNPLIIEAIWLISILLITIAFLSIILMRPFFVGTDFIGNISIPLGDASLIFAGWQIVLLPYLFATFIVYFIKESRQSFSRQIPNWIALISGIATIYALTIHIKLSFNSTIGGFTAYPPLTVIPQEKDDTFVDLISDSLIGVQMIILVMLLYVAYCCGIAKNIKTQDIN